MTLKAGLTGRIVPTSLRRGQPRGHLYSAYSAEVPALSLQGSYASPLSSAGVRPTSLQWARRSGSSVARQRTWLGAKWLTSPNSS
jgi:hypothetical protein